MLRLRSDEQLVALFRAGHDEAFGAIHERYHKRLMAYARQMLPLRQDAEDALQDVFVRAYAGLRAGDGELALRAWLFRVAHNRCIDELRRPGPPPPEVMALIRFPTHDPIAAAEQRESLRRLIDDVRRLPAQQRSALLLRELAGMSYSELADVLGVTIPALKSLLVRARVGLVQAAAARDADCGHIREQLADAHDRGARPTATARHHMRDCSGCRSFRRELRGVSRRLAAVVPAAGPLAALAHMLGFSGGAGSGATAGGAGAGGVTAAGAAGGAGAGSAASAVAGGGVATGGGAVASGGAVAGGGAVASGGAVAGGGAVAVGATSHVATLIAAAVATAGGAVEIQHVAAPPPPAHVRVAAHHGYRSPSPPTAPVAAGSASVGVTLSSATAAGAQADSLPDSLAGARALSESHKHHKRTGAGGKTGAGSSSSTGGSAASPPAGSTSSTTLTPTDGVTDPAGVLVPGQSSSSTSTSGSSSGSSPSGSSSTGTGSSGQTTSSGSGTGSGTTSSSGTGSSGTTSSGSGSTTSGTSPGTSSSDGSTSGTTTTSSSAPPS